MALTLIDLAASTPDNMVRGIVKILIDRSPVLGLIPFDEAPSLRRMLAREVDLPTTGFRKINEAFTDSAGTHTKEFINLAVFGGSFTIDDVMQDVPDFNGQQFAAQQLGMLSRSVSLNLKSQMVNGTVATAGEFAGIDELLDTIDPATVTSEGATVNLLWNSASGGDVLDNASEAVENFNRGVDACETVPDFILAPLFVIQELEALALSAAQNNALSVKFRRTVINVNGRNVAIGMFNDIPIYPLGRDATGAEILTDPTTGDRGSVYFVVAQSSFFQLVQQKASGPDIKIKSSTSGDRWVLNWPLAVAIDHPRSVVRIRGVQES